MYNSLMYSTQGWEFAHLISERIARLCPKMSDSLIRSFLVSNLSNSLISFERLERIAHGRSFFMSKMSDSLTSQIEFERNERFTHIAHQKREKGAKMSDSLIFSNFFFKTLNKT